MFLAVREIRRAKVRFSLLAIVTALLVFLILVLQTFQIALVSLFVGAIENQSGAVLVFDVDGRRSLTDSTITAELEAQVRNVDGVDAVGRIGQSIVPVTVASIPTIVSIIGYDPDGPGGPTRIVAGRAPKAAGEGVASEAEFSVGDVVAVPPGRQTIEVVGLSRASELFASSLFTPYDTYLAALQSSNPDALEPRPNALAVRPAPEVGDAELIDAINAVGPDADALSRGDAAALNPSVRTVTALFNSLLPLFGIIVPLVTGAFFAVITAQKSGTLTLLRAIGAANAALIRSLLAQVVLILGVGLATGTALYWLVTTIDVAGVDLPFEADAVIFWSLALLGLGTLSSLFSARQVLRIDPITATTGAGR